MKYFEKIVIVFFVFAVFFVVTALALPVIQQGMGLSPDSRHGILLLSVCQAVLLFIIPSFVCARLISRSPLSFLQLKRPPTAISVLGVVFAFLIALPALNQIIYWNAHMEFPDGMQAFGKQLAELEESANARSHTLLDTSSWGSLFVNLAVVALLVAVAEEMFFRGTMQRAIASNGANYTAIWVTAIIFSMLHFQIFGFIPRLLLGAWFGYLLYWSRSLYLPIIAHFINNGVVVVAQWLTTRGIVCDFENLGVTASGFPFPAAVSAVAFIIFIIFFRHFFFYAPSRVPR